MKSKACLSGLLLLGAITMSCCGQKTVSTEETKNTTMEETTFDSTGFTSGTIVQSKAEGDCEWSIELADGRFLDPQTMEKEFMQDGATVWFKFTPQRRMQRCDKASPVAINEIRMK